MGNYARYCEGEGEAQRSIIRGSALHTSCRLVITTYKTQWLPDEQVVITDHTLPHVADEPYYTLTLAKHAPTAVTLICTDVFILLDMKFGVTFKHRSVLWVV